MGNKTITAGFSPKRQFSANIEKFRQQITTRLTLLLNIQINSPYDSGIPYRVSF